MGVLTDRNFNEILNKKDIVIYPLSTVGKKRITGLGYDLAIGKIVPLNEIDKFVDDGDIIRIPPKCYCLLITEEFVWLSEKYIGTLHIRGTLAAKGLYTNCTNVDPGFGGQMIMSVYNLSEVDIVINKSISTTFITLIVHEVKNNAEVKVGIGADGTKNATRVLDEMLEEIYIDKQVYSKQIENIHKLIIYSRKMNDEVFPSFNDLLSKAKPIVNLSNRNFLSSFIDKVNVFFESTIFKIVRISGALVALILLVDFFINYLDKTVSQDIEFKKLGYALFAAIITVIDKIFKPSSK